jgi:hypothetical protein
VRGLDLEAFRGFLNRPTPLLAQAADLMTKLDGNAAERGGLTMMCCLWDAVGDASQGRRVVWLCADDEIFYDRIASYSFRA